jgi:site-specific recombinase XerD
MLASRLGLRSSDIVNLTEDNIDLKAKTISIVQVKTSAPQKLVMNDEVKDALFDYIDNGRPQSESLQLFLHSKAPFLPIKAATCFAITKKYFDLAGISAQGRRQGPHALRASYASALVAKGVPYSVVQKALGHEDIESSKHYVRTDANRLRNCALDVPKPTGAFAAVIGDLEVAAI